MKLARINHIRCREYSACTFVWVRDDMSEDELEARVYAAQKEYLAALTEFSQAEKPVERAPYQPNWEKLRDRNVGEVLDQHKEEKAKAKAFDEVRRKALKTFGEFLAKQEGIESFWGADDPPVMKGEVDWGHMHGTRIEYGETEWPEFRLLKATKRGAPGGRVMVVSDDEEWL